MLQLNRSVVLRSAVLAMTMLVGAYACHKQSPESRKRVATETTPPTPAKPQTRVTPAIVLTDAEQQTARDFEKRAGDYASFRDKLEGSIKSLDDKSTPEEIVKHQQALAALVQKERKNAVPGEFFTPETVALFKRIIVSTVAGKDDKAEKGAVTDENPGTMPTVNVNDKYPAGVTVTTMPVDLLDQLPKLPDKMEYRFLGKRLVLMDSESSLVIDVTENILP